MHHNRPFLTSFGDFYEITLRSQSKHLVTPRLSKRSVTRRTNKRGGVATASQLFAIRRKLFSVDKIQRETNFVKNFRRKIILSWNCLLFNRVAVLKKVGLFRKNLSMKVRFWFRNVYIYLRCVIFFWKTGNFFGW